MICIKDQKSNKIKKQVYILIGIICVILGVIGIIVPLLPTTPFLLLAAWLFARSSGKLYHWLMYNKVFGKYINDYVNNKKISLSVKLVTLTLLWAVILFSVISVCESLWLRILLLTIALAVSTHILLIKTGRKGPNS